MTELENVQQWMQEALFSGASDPEITAAHVLPTGELTAQQRLAIYQRGYYARLIACLEGQFKALKTALGEELFRDFAREYLQKFPSGSATLADLGTHFVAFLEENRPDKELPEKESWIDFMVELARFEWDLYTVFDRKGSEAEDQATVGTPDALLLPQRCLFLHTYRFPVNRYFADVAQEKEPDFPTEETVYIAFVRTNYVTRVFALLEPQHFFLQEMLNGKPAIAALEATREHFGSTDEKALKAWQEWRRNWIEAGFFVLRS